MRQALYLLMMLAGIAAMGCEPTMDLPPGFVEVDRDDGEYDMRAVSAEGVVVGIRSEPNPKQGGLEFWAKAVEKELAGRRGYALSAREDVGPAINPDGVLMSFDVTKQATNFRYLVAVFVRYQEVVVAEAGGPADAVEPIEASLRTALLSVR